MIVTSLAWRGLDFHIWLDKNREGQGSSRSGECEMEHWSIVPHSRPINHNWESQARIHWDHSLVQIFTQIFWLNLLYLSQHPAPVSPLKGVTRRYTQQLLTLLFYFTLNDGAYWPPISANLAIRTKDDLNRVWDWVSYLLYCHYSIFYSYLENVTNGVHDPSPANGNTATAPRSGAKKRDRYWTFSYLILSGDTFFSDWEKY